MLGSGNSCSDGPNNTLQVAAAEVHLWSISVKY